MPCPSRKLKKLISRAAVSAGLEIGENQLISVSYVGKRTIARINSEYVNHKGITDVITFNYAEFGELDENDTAVEIIICVDVALNEGNNRSDSSYENELVLYTVHGLLHAAGEDDLSKKKKERMRIREKEVMAALDKEFDFTEIFPIG